MLLAGPNHVSMQQTAQSTLPTTSMSMSGSGHGSGPGYSHSGPASQSVPLQGQGAIGNYVSRANINMQSNPGTSLLGPGAPPPPAPGTPSQAQHGPWGPAEGVQAVHRVLGLPKWRGTLGSGFVVGLSAVPRGSFRRHPCQGVESGSQGMGAV